MIKDVEVSAFSECFLLLIYLFLLPKSLFPTQNKPFICNDGIQCTTEDDHCNNITTCRDGSDEKQCYWSVHEWYHKDDLYYNSGRKQLKLANIKHFQFDFISDNVTCPAGYFECPESRHCMPIFLRCNSEYKIQMNF